MPWKVKDASKKREAKTRRGNGARGEERRDFAQRLEGRGSSDVYVDERETA